MAVDRRITEGPLSVKECPASLIVRNSDSKTAIHTIISSLGEKSKRFITCNIGKGVKGHSHLVLVNMKIGTAFLGEI